MNAQSERMQRRFSETFNPLLSFSSEDIADMDREVEDILHEFDETDDDDDDASTEGKLSFFLIFQLHFVGRLICFYLNLPN